MRSSAETEISVRSTVDRGLVDLGDLVDSCEFSWIPCGFLCILVDFF
jgi:hypothetical protein